MRKLAVLTLVLLLCPACRKEEKPRDHKEGLGLKIIPAGEKPARAPGPKGAMIEMETQEVKILLIRPDDGQIRHLEAKSPLLGLFDGVHFAEETVGLVPGDKVLFYSDAVSEAARADGEMLGVTGLCSFLKGQSHLGVEALVEQVHAHGQAFSGRSEYEDDFTLVGLEIKRPS